jgi:hypothetical protein
MNFMTFHILGIIIQTDFHIFQRGRYTTNQEVMKFLQQCRADLNQPCSDRMLTPLMLAAEHGQTKLVQRCLVMICDDSSTAPKHPASESMVKCGEIDHVI